jgi:hypothetical protein
MQYTNWPAEPSAWGVTNGLREGERFELYIPFRYTTDANPTVAT